MPQSAETFLEEKPSAEGFLADTPNAEAFLSGVTTTATTQPAVVRTDQDYGPPSEPRLPSDPYAGTAEEMVRPVTEALPAVTEDAAKALALMQYAEQTQPGRWTKQPESVGEWVKFVGGGILSPIKQTESAVESALIAVGAAKPGDRLLYRPSEALERPHLGKPLPLVPPQEGNQFTGKIPAEIAGGLANAAIGFANFLQTPEGTLSLGLGKVPKEVQRVVLGFWATKLATEAPKQFEEAYKAAKAGNVQEAVQHATEGAGGVFLSGLMAKHATFAPTKPSGLTPVDAAFKESTIPKTDQAVESVIKPPQVAREQSAAETAEADAAFESGEWFSAEPSRLPPPKDLVLRRTSAGREIYIKEPILVESVTEAKGPVLQPPAPTPTAVVSESGTVPVSAGNIPPARATLPLEEAQGRPTQGVSTEGAIKQAEPEQAVYPVRYSRETGGMVDSLGRAVDAEHKVIGKPPPVEPISMGGATPADLTPAPLKTAVKNAEMDKAREARNLSPILGPERQKNTEVWDRVMQKIDADPAWQDRLIEETKKTPRALTPDETLALDHRYVDLQNEYGKAVRDGEQHMKDGYELGVEQAKERAAHYEGKLNEIELVAKQVGTESGRSLAMRRQLIKEDFTLESMQSRMRAAKGFKPLSEKEHAQIKVLRDKLDAAEKALAEAEAGAKPSRNKRMPLDPKVARKRGEVQLLQDQFLRDLDAQRQKQRTLAQKAWVNTKETANLVRSVKSAFDLSAVGRQGWLIGVGNPARAVRNIGPMFRALRNDRIAQQFEEQIKARPNHQSGAYARAKLFLAPREGKLSGQEEAFMSRLASRIPGVAASQRAYVTFLNLLRADTFDALHDSLIRQDKGTDVELLAIGNYINVATGRGPLGKKGEAAAEGLATVFWSPRLVASRFQYAVGQPMWQGNASTRYLIAREYAKTLTALGVVYGLATLGGAEVEDDPRSADFGKLKFGDSRVDVLAGLSQTSVFTSRFITGRAVSGKGKPYPAESGKTLINFLRNKVAPLIGSAWDARDIIVGQKPPPGHPQTLEEVALGTVTPMTFNDIYEIMVDEGVPAGTALELLNFFGLGLQHYDARRPR